LPLRPPAGLGRAHGREALRVREQDAPAVAEVVVEVDRSFGGLGREVGGLVAQAQRHLNTSSFVVSRDAQARSARREKRVSGSGFTTGAASILFRARMSAPPPTRRRAFAGRVRRLAVDTRPLRASHDFRLLWSGGLLSQIGSQVTLVALFVQVYELTHSSAAVGLIGVVQLVPMVLVSIGLGPQLALRDRRLLLIAAQLGLMLSSLLLLAGAIAGHPPLVLVYGAAALNAAFVSISMPTRAAMTPNLVPPNLLAQSAALNQVMWNGAGVVGPALGGVVVGQFGLAWAYGIDATTYVVAVGFALMLRPQRPERGGLTDEDDRGWAAIRNGLRYLKGKRV